MSRAYVAFGANCGDPPAMYARVAAALAARAEVAAVRSSRLVGSVAVGDGADRYLNGCYEVRTDAAPRALFGALRQVEADFGRTEKGNWAPRTVDLDLVLHGDHVVEDADFLLPHPRMHFRRFVLAPLAELRPDARHPLLRLTVAELIGRLDERRVAWAGTGPAPAWPTRHADGLGRTILHGGQVVGVCGGDPHPLIALAGDLPPAAPAPAGGIFTPVVDCRAATPAEVARQLAFLRQSLAPVEPLGPA